MRTMKDAKNYGGIGAILLLIGVGGISFFETLEHMDPSNPEAILEFVAPFLGGVILALVVGWIFFIVSSIYLRKSYTAISEKTNVDAFKTAGLLYFIGALTVIIIVGFIIMFIARIFEIIAYFGLPEEYNDQTISPLDQKFEKII